MNKKLVGRASRISLSLIVALTTLPSFGATNDGSHLTPQMKLSNGGGKLPPPNTPPVTYAGGGSDHNPKKNSNGNGNGQAGNFGDVWAVDSTGITIYRAGYLDEHGRIVVWRKPSPGSPFVRTGIVLPDSSHPEGMSISWSQRNDTYENFVKKIQARGQLKFSKALPQRVQPSEHKFLDWAGDEAHRVIRYQGRRDLFNRELVFRPRYNQSTGFDYNTIETGYVEANGSITWDAERPSKTEFAQALRNVAKAEKNLSRADQATLEKNVDLIEHAKYQFWSTNFYDKAEIKSGEAKSETRQVRFQGRSDEKGRELVFRAVKGLNGNLNLTKFETGAYNHNGTVEWNPNTTSSEILIRQIRDQIKAKKNARSPELQKYLEANLAKMQQQVGANYVNTQADANTAAAKASPGEQVPALLSPGAAAKVARPQNYPAANLDKTPQAKGRALVPVGEAYTPPREGGHSATNSPSRTYLPEFDPVNKPSQLGKLLNWSRESSAELRETVRQQLQGKDDGVSLKPKKPLTSEEAIEYMRNKPVVNLPAYAISYYFTLGLAAGYTLMTDYPDNPMAWDSYIKTIKDPVGYLTLAGFMAVAGGFSKVVGGLGVKNGPGLRQIPLFAGGLMAGTLASTIVSDMAHNPNVQACLGFANYQDKGVFLPNRAACDIAYRDFMDPEKERSYVIGFAENFMPQAANIAVSTLTFYAAIGTMRFVVSRTGLARAMQSIPVMKSPKGGAYTLLATATFYMATYFGASAFSNQVFQTEKSVREYLLTEHNLESDPNGNTLSAAETNLFTEYAHVKKSGWKDPNLWDHVCVNSNKTHAVYNCDAPDEPDFEKSLERHATLEHKWRILQMSATMDAYQAWLNKVTDYTKSIDNSYRFYKANIDLMVQLNNNHGEPILTASEAPDVKDPYASKKNYDGAWKYVITQKQSDFLLTSMACGPEAEGYGTSGGFIANVGGFLNDHLNPAPNDSPSVIMTNPKGFAITFYPPRIVTPTGGSNNSICQQPFGPSQLPGPLGYIQDHLPDPIGAVTTPSLRFSPQTFPYQDQNRKYRGIFDYVEHNLRSSVLNGDLGSNFDTWWSNNVLTKVVEVNEILRADYKKMLDTTYKAAITDPNIYYCEPGVQVPGLEYYLNRLSVNTGEKCSAGAIHRLSNGLFMNLHEQMRQYLALLIDLYMSNVKVGGQIPTGSTDDAPMVTVTSMAQYENAIVPKAQALLAQFDVYVANAAISDSRQRVPVADLQKTAGQALTDLHYLVLNSDFGLDDAHKYQGRWSEALIKQVQSLLNETHDYYDIVTTFEK